MQGSREKSVALAVAALGVVFGDIGTSPLYTLKACFDFSGAQPVAPDVLGICSLLVWALVLVVCVKYIGFIMRVDHDGEGGILALLARAMPKPARHGGLYPVTFLTLIVIIGAAMLFGDGIITPAISVISAVEGIGVVSDSLHRLIVPVSVGVLLCLFAIQVRGTERVGRLFGPAMVAWFVSIGVAGAIAIARVPLVLEALDPRHAIAFTATHGPGGFFVLGGVVLAVTGVEALYADLSHFGRTPIVRAWFALVFPTLVLAYLGEGARVIADPRALANPFYALTPGWALIPMVALATIATVIASQALISGAYTLVEQAIALDLCPRMLVHHTSRRVYGQVYLPSVTVWLAVGCILLVVAFRSSDRLAAAFGLAVSVTMLATSIAYYAVVTRALHWKRTVAIPIVTMFIIIDGSFVLAGLPKFLDGGWLPIAISVVLTTVAVTWREGRRRVVAELTAQQTPVEAVVEMLAHTDPPKPATMVFLTPDPAGVPFLAKHRWIRDRAREERIVVLHVDSVRRPYVPEDERVTIEHLSTRLIRVSARFGYMEPPRITPILRACGAMELQLDNDETSFFFSEPKLVKAPNRPLPRWQRNLYRTLQRNSRPLPDDLHIVAERQVALGITVRV